MVLDKMVQRALDNVKPDTKPEIMEKGEYRGYTYYICFSRLCPTAYVKLPENSRWVGNDFTEIHIGYQPHGCFTYCDNRLGYGVEDKGWFVGWDYGHDGDFMHFLYCGYHEMLSDKFWTMDEIRDECKAVIDAFIKDAKTHQES